MLLTEFLLGKVENKVCVLYENFGKGKVSYDRLEGIL
jgi:hypothetical protein